MDWGKGKGMSSGSASDAWGPYAKMPENPDAMMGMMAMMTAMMSGMDGGMDGGMDWGKGKGKGKGKDKGKGGKSGYGKWGGSAAQTSSPASIEDLQKNWDPFRALKKNGVAYTGAYTAKDGGGEEKVSDGMPEIVMIQVSANSPHVQQGFPQDVVAMEHVKGVGLFSESHNILQTLLFENGMSTQEPQFDHDPESTAYPDIYQAWKAAGREDNMPTVASLPNLKIWAVGFGGKVNALRAAKLGLAISLCSLVDQAKLQSLCDQYPQFGQLITAMILRATQAAEAAAAAAQALQSVASN